MLFKHKGFTAIAVLTLALGIGANTAIFSVVNALMLRPLPVKDPDELVLIASVNGTGPENRFSYPLYEQLRAGSHYFSGFFAASNVSKRYLKASGAEAELIRTQEVTGNFFSLLGVSATLGRTIAPEDDRPGSPQRVAVISYSFWHRRFGADPAVVGKTIIVEENVPLTIVGVAPPSFFGVEPGQHPDLWWPLQTILQAVPDQSRQVLNQDGNWWLHLMGRLPAGVNRAQVRAELDVIFQRHWAEFIKPKASYWDEKLRQALSDRKLELQPGAAGYTGLRDQFRQSLILLMVAVGLVLLIACANVASLMLARAAARRREFTVRSALGAGRLRLVRQLLTESMLLAALGGSLGIVLAQCGTQALLTFMRLQADPIAFNVAPDARVLSFTLAASLMTGLLFGLAPTIHSSRLDLTSALKGATGSVAGNAMGQRLNQALVVTQVAFSVILLVCAGLFVRTLQKLRASDAGFDRENVVVFDLDFTRRVDAARRATLYKDLSVRLETLPGVRATGMSSSFVLGDAFERHMVRVEGDQERPGEDHCNEFMISSRFFETTGTTLLNGRSFGAEDERPAELSKADAPVAAVINQAMARRYFGDANPLGRHFYCRYEPELKFEIVGVVKDVRYKSLRSQSSPAYYKPFFQDQKHNMEMTFAIRTMSDSGALVASLRRIAREIDPTIQVRDVRSLTDVVNTSLHKERVVAQLGGFFSLFALALACLGLYGVLSFAVVQRTRELGVRIALGAHRGDVLALVINQGLKLSVLGLALGLVAALVMTRFIESLLYGVTATDPVVFVGVSSLLLVVAVLASWLPARRATKLDPMTVLRHD